MRQIGTISNEQQARQFEDYLLVNGIRARVDHDGDLWDVWIYDEDQLDRAKAEYLEFLRHPYDARYEGHTAVARETRQNEEKQNREYRRRQIDIRKRWGRQGPAARAIPLTWILIAVSTAFAFATTFGDDRSSSLFLSFTLFNLQKVEFASQYPQLEGILDGEVWRIFTPMFIHFGPMHILFNMMWLHRLGGQMETRLGGLKFLGVVLFISAASNMGQYFWMKFQNDLFSPEGHVIPFGGMSGVVYGLFGFIWMKARYEPREAYLLTQSDVRLFLIWLFVCMTGFVGPIANAAHLIGLIAGCACGYWETFWKDLRFGK